MKENELEEVPGEVDSLTIFTLLVRCPSGRLINSACPFLKHRNKLSIEEKFRLAEALPENERREMLAFHNNCLTAGYAKEKSNDN